MLGTLVSAVGFIRSFCYYVFHLSYKTGDVLVKFIKITLQGIVSSFDALLSFLKVLLDSVIIFSQDISHFVQQVVIFLTSTVDVLHATIVYIILKVSSIIIETQTAITLYVNSVLSGITTIVTCVGQVFVIFKKILILFGSGVWFLITLIPLLIYYGGCLVASFLHNSYLEICDIFHNTLFNLKLSGKNALIFILDVPVESIAGLIIALSLGYVFSQFYILIISFCKLKIRKIKDWYQRQHMQMPDFLSYVRRQRTSQRMPQPTQVVRSRQAIRGQVQQPTTPQNKKFLSQNQTQPKQELNEVNCCVICQERSKCVLLLPCRHLCLCWECTRELRFYNEACPVCRTAIENTMKIFV